jgi:hypothetical protein
VQFGRTVAPALAPQPAQAAVAVAEAPRATKEAQAAPVMVSAMMDGRMLEVEPAPIAEAAPAPKAKPEKTTDQKILEFYGVKQIGRDVVFRAKFNGAHQVVIAGDFNNWSKDATPMEAEPRAGEWRTALPLTPGRYRYRLVVDGKWMTDPNNQYVEANQFGELNNIVEVE